MATGYTLKTNNVLMATGYTLSTWANSWHNTLSDWTYLAINLCLRLAISISISSGPNQYRHSAIMSIDIVRKTFVEIVFKLKSNDLIWVLYTGHASKAYSKHGIHLNLINWRITSSEPLLPILPYTMLNARTEWCCAIVKVTFKIPCSDKMNPRYLIESTHCRT